MTERTDPITDEGQAQEAPAEEAGQADSAPTDDGQTGSEEKVYVYTDDEGNKYTVDDLKGGIMRHRDYTKKTQELAEKRRELEEKINLLAAGESYLEQTDPAFLAYLQGLGELPTPRVEFDDPVEEIKHELNTFKQKLTLEQKRTQLMNALNSLPDNVDKNEVLMHMKAKNIGDPIVAYRDMTYDKISEKARREAEAEIKAKIKKAQEERLGTPQNTSATHASGPPPDANWRDKLKYTINKTYK